MKHFLIFITFITLIYSCQRSADKLSIANMQCEYLENPIGIDSSKPRFTWQIKSDTPSILQKAVQIFVGTNAEDISCENGNVWQSGTIFSSTIPVVYAGTALQPFTRYFWSVKVQNRDGSWSPLSGTAFFETGMMRQNNWKGDWITIYEKWMADHQDEQQPNGVLPAIIPSDGWGYHWANGPDWTSTIAFIPWNIYLFYGDSRLLENCYDNIKPMLTILMKLAPQGLPTGDWETGFL